MNIGVWGDSIVYGVGDVAGLDGWVGRLRRECSGTVAGFYNRGIRGETTDDLLRRFDIEIESINPDVIFLAIGINDSKFPNNGTENKVSLENYCKNLDLLIAKALHRTQNVYVVGLTEVDEVSIGSSSIFKNEEIRKYNVVLQEAASKHGVTFIEMHGILNSATDLSDGLHPDSVGYEKMAIIILSVLKQSLYTPSV